MNDKLHITIDGPAASGKSATAKKLSQDISIPYIDTGIMYRGLTYFMIRYVENFENRDVIENFDFSSNIRMDLDDSNILYINDENISGNLYSKEVTDIVSFFSSINSVRKYLVNEQKNIAFDKDLIMIGRDIGTVVLPKAKYKFFLDSNIETRTKRRMDQKKININDQAEIDKNFDSIKNRDLIDKSRDLSPLKPAQDAIIIYNDHIDLNATVDLMKNIILD